MNVFISTPRRRNPPFCQRVNERDRRSALDRGGEEDGAHFGAQALFRRPGGVDQHELDRAFGDKTTNLVLPVGSAGKHDRLLRCHTRHHAWIWPRDLMD